MSCRNFLIVLLSSLAAFFFSIRDAGAHRLRVSVDVNEQEISVRGFFGRRSPCRNCRITVADDEGNEVFSGRTDKNGRSTFRPDNLGKDLVITVRDSMGHRGTERISAEELEVMLTDEAPHKDSMHEPPETPEKISPETDSAAGKDCLIHKKEIAELVRKEVSQQIRTGKHSGRRHDQHESFNIRDLIAGLGFIFGLAGLILAASKKKRS